MVDDQASGIFVNKFGLAVRIIDRSIVNVVSEINGRDCFKLSINNGNRFVDLGKV
jgi:hypothetical protein